jgi:tRNA modification GTPase
VIFVKDVNARDPALQDALFEEVSEEGKTIVTVINKADLLPKDFGGCLKTSCKTGEGIEDLKNKIVEVLSLCALQEDDILITSAVHYDALVNAGKELEMAKQTVSDLELMAEHLRCALRLLRELIGEVTPDSVLDVIFSKFCVGK